MRLRRGVLVASSLVLVGAVVAAAFLLGSRAPQAPAVDPHGTALPTQREVALSLEMPAPSSMDGLHAMLVGGTMPGVPTQATVLTDEDCAPDAVGISHCLNRLRLPDGTEIEVRHPHDMRVVACLAPGERVRLVPGEL